MAPLHRAVAFEQINGAAVGIGKHLHLDVTRTREIFLQQHSLVTESRSCFALGGSDRILELRGTFDDAHTFPAAACRSLDQNREADASRLALERIEILRLAVIARHQRHAGLAHDLLRRTLRTHRLDGADWGTDEHHSRCRTGLREIGVLRQEAVPWMDRLRAGLTRHLDDAISAQIALSCRRPGRSGAPRRRRPRAARRHPPPNKRRPCGCQAASPCERHGRRSRLGWL